MTPSHLIYERQISFHLNHRHYEIVSTNQSLTKRAKYQQRMLDQFTRQWRNEYLLGLLESAKSSSATSKETIKIGDIVILRNDSSRRVFRKLGRVEELFPSKVGLVRAARVKIQGDGGKQVILQRRIQHLIPLDVRAQLTEQEAHGDQSIVNRAEEGKTQGVSPRRKAAIAADRFRAQLDL